MWSQQCFLLLSIVSLQALIGEQGHEGHLVALPISPYVFFSILCKKLVLLVIQGHQTGSLIGNRVCQDVLVISHLLFVDNTIIFCCAESLQANTIKSILPQYEMASRQQVNICKTSAFFSNRTSQIRKDEILLALDIRKLLTHDKYLGLPTTGGSI